jgi:hypothetical protein
MKNGYLILFLIGLLIYLFTPVARFGDPNFAFVVRLETTAVSLMGMGAVLAIAKAIADAIRR